MGEAVPLEEFATEDGFLKRLSRKVRAGGQPA
jgi:hypothetical protein